MDWSTWISTFGLIFLAELGDKTQLAVVSQTCKFRRPWPVFLGGSLALTAVTAMGVAGGRALGVVIPQSIMPYVAAAAFLVMGLLIWREAAKSDVDAVCEQLGAAECDLEPTSWDWRAFGATFSLLFLAELGDKTQLAVLSLATGETSPLLIFAGGSLALVVVTAIGVLGGQKLCEWIPEHLLLRISAGAFVAMGVLMGVGVL
ncbi:MAG: TMEM165/GDT1 family protein [Anaerolineae bacterium]|nr:TMEM165/GDT1 family protein [Anaerolineae bacterium]